MQALIFCSFIAAVAALLPSHWAPAGPTDSRSPCPGLNTLANHGFLPHDGRNITISQFVDAISKGFGFDDSVGQFLATTAFNFLGVDLNSGMDLELLNTPNVLEHNASLTRHDQPGADSLHVDPSRVDAMLADSPTNYLDVVSAAISRNRVYAESNYPNVSATIMGIMYGESSLMLIVTSTETVPAAGASEEDYYAMGANKTVVEVFFNEERLPVELGWKPLSRKVVRDDINALSAVIKTEAEKNAAK
ncbi:putative chloroperoxidase [Thozetella sp. PMI_491]|nr:putative chloroperoxidase [Thozetella sp. PMI_491]